MRVVLLSVAIALLGACNADTAGTALGTDRVLPPEVIWTPDQADLLFMSNRDGNADIFLIPAGSTEWQNLTAHPAQDNWPEWSPDGTRIAFQSDRAGNLDIWLMNADGSNPVQLTTDPANDYLPAWSPDGRQLTFASWRREGGDGEDPAVHHYAMNVDGSNQERLPWPSPGTSTAASWAPDGQSFLLAVNAPGGLGADIYQLDRLGAVVRRFTEDEPADGAPVFAPDGSEIAFHADRGDTSALVLLEADGTYRRTLLADGQQWYPRWSPDGRWLVYTAATAAGSTDLDVMAMRADGTGEPVRLAGGPSREAEGRWRMSVP